jgi:hypothetical protein
MRKLIRRFQKKLSEIFDYELYEPTNNIGFIFAESTSAFIRLPYSIDVDVFPMDMKP